MARERYGQHTETRFHRSGQRCDPLQRNIRARQRSRPEIFLQRTRPNPRRSIGEHAEELYVHKKEFGLAGLPILFAKSRMCLTMTHPRFFYRSISPDFISAPDRG